MSPKHLYSITQPTRRARSRSEVEANDNRLHSRGSSEQAPGDSGLLGMESKPAPPKYLTGDKAGIAAFVDNFDVSWSNGDSMCGIGFLQMHSA